jgi:hypothetical protein
MPAAIPIAAQVLATYIASAVGAGTATAALISGGAALLGGYIASELMGSKGQIGVPEDPQENYISTSRSIPVVYGTYRVGGNTVFAEAGKESPDSDSKDSYLWVVQVLSEGEIHGFNKVFIEGQWHDEIYIDQRPIWEFETGKVQYELYNGDFTQTHDLDIEGSTRLDSEDKFNDAMRGTAYIIFRFKKGGKGKNSIVGLPQRHIVIKGIKCFDVRTSTTVWTENPVLILYDYLTNSRYGLGMEPTSIDTDSFEEVADSCDLYNWKFNTVFSSKMKASEVIDTILGHFRGSIHWYDGKLFLKYIDMRYESPDLIINDSHIARSTSGKAIVSMSQPSRFNIPDTAVVSFINAEKNWTEDKVIIEDTSASTDFVKTIDFVGYTDIYSAKLMGTYVLRREQLNRTVTLTLRQDAIALDINDLISLTCSELALSNQPIRVKSVSTGGTGLVTLVGIFEDISLYTKEYDLVTDDVYNVYFPSPNSPPPSVTNLSIVEETYSYRDRSMIRIKVDYDPPLGYPWFSHVNVYVAIQSESPSSEDEYKYMLNAHSEFYIDPVQESQFYYIRLNSVSDSGVEQDDGLAARIGYKILGVSEVNPPCPDYLNVAVNITSVDITGRKLPSPDIAGYEVRLGSVSWSNSLFLTLRADPSITFDGVKPGVHKFWLNTKHTNGRYCSAPLNKTVTLEDPPPGSYGFFSQVVDYATGTGTNVTVTGTYPNQTLKCSHTGLSLVGEYTSLEIDTVNLNVDEKMLAYVLFGFTLTGNEFTWEKLVPIGTTWEDFAYIAAEDRWKSWYEIIGDDNLSPAPSVQVSVEYATISGGPYTTVDRLELLTALIRGRYVRIKYRIEDINNESYLELSASTFKAAYLERALLIGV